MLTFKSNIKRHFRYVEMTLECKIFVRKALGYFRHFSPLSVTKPLCTSKSDGRSHWLQSRTKKNCEINPEQPHDLFLTKKEKKRKKGH